jgi:alternate signal-mediated exported protein
MMNKLNKGLIVGGAGLVLVVAGASSFALWNGSASVDAGPVDSGVMTIAAADGTWSDDITLWVPGDVSTYTTDVTISLAGDNLTSQLALDGDSITGDADLLAALDIELTVGTITGGTAVPVPGEENTFTLTSLTPTVETALTVPVTVTVDFPADSVTGVVAQNQSVDLGSIAFNLTQLAP